MLVYIAAPYTSDPEHNTLKAIDAAEAILKEGIIPFIPHLSHYWHLRYEHPWEEWLRIDTEILLRCDAVLRLPGESKGADLEVETAKLKWIPVFYDIDSLVRWYRELNVT
jgi:hypothetical protein